MSGHERGDPRFKEHRDSFITEEDFIEIKRANLNTVRIPVGYWITGFDNTGGSCAQDWEKFAPGSLQYLDTAIREWAPKHGLLVIINIQAAKGSQNGEQHSSPSKPGSSLWWHRENVVHTLDVVEFLANRYKNDEAFLGIGLLNGPAGIANFKMFFIIVYTWCDIYHYVSSYQSSVRFFGHWCPYDLTIHCCAKFVAHIAYNGEF